MPAETRDLTINQALDLGVQCAMSGNHPSAIGLFRGVLVHEPENFEAIERLGASLFELQQYHEALYWFWRGRKLNRKHPMALTNYGLTICQLGHSEEGLADLERAVHHAERMPDLSTQSKSLCYNNLGNTLEKLHRYEEALAALNKGIHYDPNDSFPYYNRGVVLMRLNRQKEGMASLQHALFLNPADHEARYNLSMAKLLTGNLKAGFVDYECRLVTASNEVINLGLPADKKWKGEPLEGKTILVHCEQGLGDDIQFLRFLPELIAKANPASVLLIMHSAITPLWAPMERVSLLPTGKPVPPTAYNYWVASMSLPLCLGTTQDTIPAPWVPVIEPERIRKWSEAIGLTSNTLNVGVCWAGNFQHKNDRHRSIPLATFARLFDAPGVSFVSLQQMRPGETEEFATLKEANPDLRAFYLDDFRDTAAIMLNLDMVVSVDTAVAHLSATLGVPTKILVPAFGTDWRWQLEREDTPWYRAAKLYRQPKVGDWASVIANLRDELTDIARESSAA